MTKPATLISWPCTDPGAEVTDPLTKGNKGWATGDTPAAGHFNWLMQQLYLWMVWQNTYGPGLELANTFADDQTLEGNLIFSGGGNAITGDIELSGDNTHSGANTFSDQATFENSSEETALINLDTAVTDRQLVFEYNPQNGTYSAFVYMTNTGDLETTINCKWNGSAWIPVYVSTGAIYWYYKHGAAGLVCGVFNRTAEASWSSFTTVLDSQVGFSRALYTTGAEGTSNPTSTYPLQNSISPKQVAKCWGHIVVDTPNPTVSDGVNIDHVQYNGYNIRVYFGVAAGGINGAMNSTNYAVQVSVEPASFPTAVFPQVSARNTAYFEVALVNGSGTVLDPATLTGSVVYVSVLGEQSSSL